MLELHAAYSNLGLLHMQRLTTAMIEKTELQQAWLEGGIARIKSSIYYILFEYTCNYGNNPTGPIQLMLYLTLIFTFLYCAVLYCAAENHGIIKIDAKHNSTVLKKNKWHSLIWALYFSLLNTFNIGCGNCKLAKLITALQYDDYELMPLGIVRTIAGLQSLISTYLFLLWILVCFGDPFAM
jgi:hypothetical protein